jgi:hypothetical protein
MEHRWGKRQPTNVPVRVRTAPAKIGTGRVLNMSVTGAFMETTMQLRVLSVVYLMSVSKRAANAKSQGMAACVVRQDSKGVGLEWCESLAERMSVDMRLQLLTSGGLARTHRPASPPPEAPLLPEAPLRPELPLSARQR